MAVFTDTPDVQILQLDGLFGDEGADLSADHSIALAIDQDAGGFAQQPLGPVEDHHPPHQSHDRIQPGGAPQHAAAQGEDGQHRGGSVGQHVDVGGLFI